MISLNFPNPLERMVDYHGRKEQIKKITDILLSHKACIAQGERRSGKTSTMNVIADFLASYHTANYKPLVVKQYTDEDAKVLTFKSFAHTILERLASSLNSSEQESAEFLARHVSFPVETVELFEQAFRTLLAAAPAASSWYFILMLDEFEVIQQLTHEGEAAIIHHLINRLLRQDSFLPLTVFMTMTCLPDSITSTLATPLISEIEVITIRPLHQTEFEALLKALFINSLDLEPDSINYTYALSGGWPFYAKLLLSALIQEYGLDEDSFEVTREKLDTALQLAVKQRYTLLILTNIYDVSFQEDERCVMLLLVYLQRSLLAAELKALGARYTKAAKQLVNRFYLENDKNSNTYHLKIKFWKEWLLDWERYDEECDKCKLAELIKQFDRAAIEIDVRDGKVRVRDTALDLTDTEHKLMLALAEKVEKLVDRNTLLDKVWGTDYISSGALDTTIGRLRDKLSEQGLDGKKYIELVRKQGYILHDARIVGED